MSKQKLAPMTHILFFGVFIAFGIVISILLFIKWKKAANDDYKNSQGDFKILRYAEAITLSILVFPCLLMILPMINNAVYFGKFSHPFARTAGITAAVCALLQFGIFVLIDRRSRKKFRRKRKKI